MAGPHHARFASILAGTAVVLCAACGGSSNPPSPGPPGGGGGETITGRERIGWTQAALDAEQLATFSYAAYVDGVRRVLEGAACPGSGNGPFECAAPLPPMGAGQHTIELVSFIVSENTTLESERSAPLRVTVSAVAASATVPADAALTTSEGHQFKATIAASGLDDPTDLAVAPDGRVFVTERAGRVRILREHDSAMLALDLADVTQAVQSGLTSIALDLSFDSNGFVYLAYGSETRDTAVLKVARFRERNDVLAQGALVVRERTESPVHATVRFGGDGKLYVGVGAGNDPQAAQDLASPRGKVLRMNADGTTPRDNPRSSVTFTSGHREPRGLVWQSNPGVMWEVDRDRDRGDELNTVVAGSDYGWPITMSADTRTPALLLPPETDVAGIALVPDSSRSPFTGELLIASRGAEDLIRVQINAQGRTVMKGGVVPRLYGRLSAVAVAANGTIYAATSNRDTWGPGNDVVIRIAPTRVNASALTR